jgi:fatty acid/phospholipid biosynthesis enzyme
MGMTNAMRDYWAQSSIGEAVTAFDNANAYIAAGDSATAFAATQTDLQAATNKLRKAMDATYPQRSGNVLTFRATFATGDANFAWNEWGIFNAAAAGTMMQRKVENLGTKTSAQSWQMTATITINAGS